MLLNKIKRKIHQYLILLVQKPRILFYKLLSNNSINGKPKFIQPVQVVGYGEIVCGNNVKFGFFPSPGFFSTYTYLEARSPDSKIIIGSGTWFNNNISIISEHAGVIIGENCLIGINVEIIDSDFHPISIEDREAGKAHESKGVNIGNNVFIGSNVKILKGVTIGDGAVIGNGTIVSKDIAAMVVAVGNPVKIIKHLGME